MSSYFFHPLIENMWSKKVKKLEEKNKLKIKSYEKKIKKSLKTVIIRLKQYEKSFKLCYRILFPLSF